MRGSAVATLHRLVIGWQGPMVVGTAVSVMHFEGSDSSAPPVADVLAAFAAAAALFPEDLVITVPASGDSIDDTTGELTGVWTTTGGGTVEGTTAFGTAAGVGACITWLTGGIVAGKKLRGRTFIVPIHAQNYAVDGTLVTSSLLVIQTLANDLQAAGGLGVWHRPTTSGGSDGTSYGVIANKVSDKVAYLSSRRD